MPSPTNRAVAMLSSWPVAKSWTCASAVNSTSFDWVEGGHPLPPLRRRLDSLHLSSYPLHHPVALLPAVSVFVWYEKRNQNFGNGMVWLRKRRRLKVVSFLMILQ